MSFSPLTFTGVSTYSQDFQTILTRATSIASLPIKALQNQQSDLVQKKILLTNLNSGVDSLSTSIKSLGTVASKKALIATTSNSSKVTATNISSAAPTSYTITDITSISKSAAETSVTGYADTTTTAVSTTGTVSLKVGSNTYSLDLSGSNNLTGLRDAINAAGAGVRATVLTTGTGANPYYLSVTANEAGAKALELRDDPTGTNTNLLTAANQGANTEFKLNGVFISKTSNLINDVVPGVTFNINGTTSGSESVTVTVASDRSQISSGLQSFVSSYNAVREQINAQVGSNAGLLTGDYIVREVQHRLRSITSYQGNGSIQSLADLGVTFDTNGQASFDTTAFNSLSDSQISSTFDFLGSESSGFGAFGARLNEISDSVTGFAKIQIDRYDETDKRLNDQVSILSSRVIEMQKTLSSKLQVADALLASLQSQQNILTSTIDGLNVTIYGKQS